MGKIIEQVDTLTLLICNRIHQHLPLKSRAIKIAKTCKLVRDRTKNKQLYDACRVVITSTQQGNYEGVIEAINKAEQNYFGELND